MKKLLTVAVITSSLLFGATYANAAVNFPSAKAMRDAVPEIMAYNGVVTAPACSAQLGVAMWASEGGVELSQAQWQKAIAFQGHCDYAATHPNAPDRAVLVASLKMVTTGLLADKWPRTPQNCFIARRMVKDSQSGQIRGKAQQFSDKCNWSDFGGVK